ncbi:ISL3 family transposase [Ktedonobacter racemifer]|nr:ISL3 family transposase [Ktedonobacter racemifer]
MMMEISSLLSLPDGLEVAQLAMVEDVLRIDVVATAEGGACPLCAEVATHIRSYYTRVVADVPCAGHRVQLTLHVRKFRCDTASCPRKVFAERLGPFIEAWARKTTRLRKAIEAIGLATCGEGGARLADCLGMTTSPATVLRCVMALPLPPVEAVTHLGIDDFALRRGRTYGTVLVDLTSHKAIDLLPDRKAETAKVWMQAHSEIEVVSRDRGGDYAAAASQGAPQAVQTADRSHLCKNLTEAVEKALARCRAEIRKSQKAEQKSAKETEPEAPLPRLLTSDGKPYSAHQTERYDRYQQVVALREQGAKVKEIAKRVGLGVRTVQRWLNDGAYVETNYHHRHRSSFDRYEAYVRKRWDEGVHNIQQLWREIKAQGYPHSDRALQGHLEVVRGKKPAELEEAGVLDHFSAKKVVWLFVRPFDDLSKEEQEELLAIRQASATAETIYQLVQEFFRLVRSRQGTQLDSWLSKVEASAIPELQSFANGLERDKAAVLAGLTLIQSNDHVA